MNRKPLTLALSLLLGSILLPPSMRAADAPPKKAGDNAPIEAGDTPYEGNRVFIPPAPELKVLYFNGPNPSALGTLEVQLDKVKRIPPAGVVVPEKDRAELEAGVKQLGTEIEALQKDAGAKDAAGLLPDVQIYYNAVRYALKYDEFFDKGQIPKAKVLLNEGLERAKELREGKPAWTKASGLVVRGYVSKIDGSVQPYGLVIPESVMADPTKKHRLDIWYHGRGETLNEISFLSEHEKSAGQFTPPDTIVLHPYGRYCNGNRFAGEVDTFEALDSVKKHYTIDNNRILERGFSMGGAACWMMATHYADHWAAAAPGAGYSETADFLHIKDLSTIPWYQQKMWGLYDSTTMAVNLFDVPVVAYSGELDGQKQAADEMVKAAKEVGITFPYVIGIGAHHNYTPAAKEELNKLLDAIAAKGRDVFPKHVKLATYSLKYNTMDWVMIDALEHHWEQATVDAEIDDGQAVRMTTANVAMLQLSLWPTELTVDGMQVSMPGPRVLPKAIFLQKVDGKWNVSLFPNLWTGSGGGPEYHLQKRHNLQGPIDDAFMDSFIMVSPTGKPMNEKTGEWVKHEEAHAIDAWRKQFRGEARVKDDSAVTDADIAGSNLVLWGDPSSNAILAKIADKLPIKWDAQAVHVGDKTYPAAGNVPVLIYPNPLNPTHYVVLNSGFTFREYDYENNARQTPKLPDWAIVDITIPPSAQSPGGIADAGFFGEKWELGGGVKK
ncbi:MAG TPA: prolyl oligopeptidase family serine peptidase [Tepidisphaeraceae bacterium]|jgi:hypothetical protein|nr:prolyl oligopeptidase family serine peptidase [Tepidisphaeraceae bacterium]